MSYFKDKSVLLIGGTGTIGQSLLEYILNQSPKVVRIFSRDEYKQFVLQQKLIEHSNVRFLIGDVRDLDRLKRAMKDIDYVFHCAAMKHVPACEYNPFEAVQTNIIGTQNVIQASLEMKVKRTIFTSTDKAIAPTNTYGASKLMAERLISAGQYQAGSSDTIFASVRFGNVMGSRGSVIPLFKEQILTRSEITITSKDMVRYMMTIEQAAKLTMKAMSIAKGGEVFVLKMPIVKLENLAMAIITQESSRLGIDPVTIKMKEIGLRPGEKMYEELMSSEESDRAIELSDMYIIPNDFMPRFKYDIDEIESKGNIYNFSVNQIISYEQVKSLIKNVM